ncbi:hypothetical protein [Hyphomicrobium sp. 2TAF46]|uniref:hypothetical protein n=1 Tax=Hyphomicrobium sp. 2TAF46 TaxID=3233019 RepID=UPI003F91DA86
MIAMKAGQGGGVLVGRKRLAIISSYDEGCGNAFYSHALKLAFQEHVDVEVLALDLNLLQKHGAFVEQAADRHIYELASRLQNFDYVNIQFEAGLYGVNRSSMLRRFKVLADSAPNLIVTMHRVDPATTLRRSRVNHLISVATSGKYRKGIRHNGYAQLYKDVIDYCMTLSTQKNTWICVHTKRELRLISETYKNRYCFDYPLAFLLPETRKNLIEKSDSKSFKAKHGFGSDQKVLGVFGFFGSYKGIETAIRALSLLPDEYVLGIFGGQHPQTIMPHKEIDDYLRSILELMGFGQFFSPASIVDSTGDPKHIERLLRRIRFVGSLPDPEFMEALRCCDGVLLPYREVGQSMSGVLPLAIEMKGRLFCANNLSFSESMRYFGNVGEMFDIGNFVELAQKILYSHRNFEPAQDASYEQHNIRKLAERYLHHFEVGEQLDRT